MSDPITVSVAIDAAQLAAALAPKQQLMYGLTEVEVRDLIEQQGRWYKALDEIRRMTGTGADLIAAHALGRSA